MRWPMCKQSAVPGNTWNTGLSDFISVLSSVDNEPWWIVDSDLKYLDLRIDTRDNAFILKIGKPDGEQTRIDPHRVIDAIDKFKEKFETLDHMREQVND